MFPVVAHSSPSANSTSNLRFPSAPVEDFEPSKTEEQPDPKSKKAAQKKGKAADPPANAADDAKNGLVRISDQ